MLKKQKKRFIYFLRIIMPDSSSLLEKKFNKSLSAVKTKTPTLQEGTEKALLLG